MFSTKLFYVFLGNQQQLLAFQTLLATYSQHDFLNRHLQHLQATHTMF